ncbi:MAG: radical SAM protein [Magnetococcales bacterium]|nr:radical SAM protein [Magnetococcales bacterium]
MDTIPAPRKKFLLCYPNQRWMKEDIATTWDLPPTTLCQLGAMVRDFVEIRVVDPHRYNWTRERFQEEIRSYRPDFVGISQLTSEYAEVLHTASRLVKEIDPGIIVIAGGTHVTTTCATILHDPCIDYACRGEGEYLLRELLLHLTGSGPLPTQGLVHRVAGEIQVQPQAMVADMTKLPRAAYDLVQLEDYIGSYGRVGPIRLTEPPGMPVVVTRGCPYTCSFCQVGTISGRAIRARDPINVVDEFEFLKERYGFRSIVFEDDNLFIKKKTVKPLLREMIRRQLNFKWTAASFAIWSLDDELLDLMVEAGCVGVNVAIESGNERVLREVIRKPIKNLQKVPEQILRIQQRGIFVLANFIIGSPGETWDEIRDTIHFAEHCHADYVKLFVAVALRGTKMYEDAIRLGALEDAGKGESVDWRYSQITSPEWTKKDITILRAYEWDRINFSRERRERNTAIWGVSQEEMQRIRKETRDAIVF